MSATAARRLDAEPANDSQAQALLGGYAGHCADLGLAKATTAGRLWRARQLLSAHPDLDVWMGRPIDARLADLRRTEAWPLIGFAVLSGRVKIDIDLLAAQRLGTTVARSAERLFAADTAARQAADRLGWSPSWSQRVVHEGLTMVLAFAGKPMGQLSEADLDAFASAMEATPMARAGLRATCRNRMHALRQLLYEARVLDRPPPRRTRRCAGGLAERLEAVAPEIARVMAAYLDARGAVLKETSVVKLADNLVCFGQFLAQRHPEVTSLAGLQRAHVEAFCVWVRTRSWRGRVARDRRVSVTVARHGIIALRNFLDDIAAWGWADAPSRRLVFACDVPREPDPLPRALAPDVDAALMAAVAGLDDPFARAGLTVLRGAGLRIGELLDLELDCVVDYGSNGSWLRVPLGKLDSERSVPLDEATLAALDGWMAQRGPQRALPHPRDGRPADFLFVEHGQRLAATRLRGGLVDAVRAAGLTGSDCAPLRVTPHQLRHTYATALVNAGMSLQGLMALLGHRSPQMTLRYATLASPTLRAAYDEAMGKVRRRLPVAPAGRPAVPGRVEWLRQEMLKTRLAGGYCSRDLVAEACPYANICEGCDNFVSAPEFVPVLADQLADVTALRDDAQARGWESEVARHNRVIASIENHLRRLTNTSRSGTGS